MIAAIVAGCYAIIWLFAARRVFYAFRNDHLGPPDDGIDTAMAGLLSLIIGMMWPLALPVALVIWKPRKTPAEFQEQLEARDRRIAELERARYARGCHCPRCRAANTARVRAARARPQPRPGPDPAALVARALLAEQQPRTGLVCSE